MHKIDDINSILNAVNDINLKKKKKIRNLQSSKKILYLS